jgi:hypothetical protein
MKKYFLAMALILLFVISGCNKISNCEHHEEAMTGFFQYFGKGKIPDDYFLPECTDTKKYLSAVFSDDTGYRYFIGGKIPSEYKSGEKIKVIISLEGIITWGPCPSRLEIGCIEMVD